MKYYKILNEEECHNGLQYKTGLNVDILPFCPFGDCEPGGIYFTNAQHILYYLGYGPWIREVFLPDDAKVYKEIGKWKANKVILGERRRINDEVIRELVDEGAVAWSSIVESIEDPDLLRHIFDEAVNNHRFIDLCMWHIIRLDKVKLFEVVLEYSSASEFMLEKAAYFNAYEIAKCLIANGIQPNFTVRAFAREPHCRLALKRLIFGVEE